MPLSQILIHMLDNLFFGKVFQLLILEYLEASFTTKVHQDDYFRSNSCDILFNQNFSTSYSSCHSHCIKLTSEANRKKANLDQAAKYGPVTRTKPVKLKLA